MFIVSMGHICPPSLRSLHPLTISSLSITLSSSLLLLLPFMPLLALSHTAFALSLTRPTTFALFSSDRTLPFHPPWPDSLLADFTMSRLRLVCSLFSTFLSALHLCGGMPIPPSAPCYPSAHHAAFQASPWHDRISPAILLSHPYLR